MIKKFLSAILIGAFMISLPAANFELLFTKTVYAASRDRDYESDRRSTRQRRTVYDSSRDKDYEAARKKYIQSREAYENARAVYNEARRKGRNLEQYEINYKLARQKYEKAREEYAKYRR